jgi:hypothetical protein
MAVGGRDLIRTPRGPVRNGAQFKRLPLTANWRRVNVEPFPSEFSRRRCLALAGSLLSTAQTVSSRSLAATGLILALAGSLFAQHPVTFQYIYDDLGQIARVVDSTGVVIDCEYDPVGNAVRSGKPLI